MRLGAMPTTLLEWIAARFDLVPLPAVEALFGMLHSRIIMAGVRLGVFEALRDGPLGAEEIARRQHLDPAGARLLCNALVAARYLARIAPDRYRLTPLARRYLIPGGPHYMGHYIEYNYDQWAWVGELEDVVRRGKGLDLHQRLGGAADAPPAEALGDWRTYLGGLRDLAREAAGEIARKVPVPAARDGKARVLLDVGGGDGTFSVALCARYADLRAEIIDLPGGVAAGEELVRAQAPERVRQRIRFRAADVLREPLGAPDSYDAVLICQLLHHLPPEEVPSLLERAVGVLRPGGWVTVIDLLEPAPGQRADAATAYTSLYFYLTSQGRGYTAEEIRGWLRGAGCRVVRQRRLLRVPGQPLIAGMR